MTRAKDISKIITDADLSGTLDVTGTVTAGAVAVEAASAAQITITDNSPSTVSLYMGAGNSSVSIGSTTSDPVTFLTANTERMRITSAGQVGIGTGSPATNLHIAGTGTGLPATSGTTQTYGRIRTSGSGSNAVLDIGNAGATGAWLQVTNQTSLGNEYPLLLNPNGGNVGIGDDDPDMTTVIAYSDAGTDFNANDFTGGLGIYNTDDTNNTSSAINFKGGSRHDVVRIGAVRTSNSTSTSSNSADFVVSTRHLASSLGERFRITSNGSIGIGTSSPSAKAIHAVNASSMSDGIILESQGLGDSEIEFRNTYSGNHTWAVGLDRSNSNAFVIGYANALGASLTDNNVLTIDTSGNLLVGKTASGSANLGSEIRPTGAILTTSDGNFAAVFNRETSDGEIIRLKQDDATIGGIYSSPSLTGPFIGHINVGLAMYHNGNSVLPSGTGGLRDNAIDLGNSGNRFDDIYATNSTIQTSDRNEKQDIEELSDAEQRVAVVAKGLMRKFRWIDSVAEKGDNARTHFGIIAQDLQDAFTAEGLDAGDYAMFTSTTWWEKEISVDAVEADEANGIEAKDAYTYKKIAEEATEGYTEKTRLGVRYNQLLAFIISAI